MNWPYAGIEEFDGDPMLVGLSILRLALNPHVAVYEYNGHWEARYLLKGLDTRLTAHNLYPP